MCDFSLKILVTFTLSSAGEEEEEVSLSTSYACTQFYIERQGKYNVI